jgi:hypothetical protein
MHENAEQSSVRRRGFGTAGLMFSCVFVLLAGTAWVLCDTWRHPAAVSSARVILQIDEPSVTLEADPGEVLVKTFRITNMTGEPLRVVGTESTCGCVQAVNVPMDLAPHGTAELKYELYTGSLETSETLDHKVRIFVDHPSPEILLHIVIRRKA